MGRQMPSATAGSTQGCLDLERDLMMHIIEERSKENPKLQRNQPITTEYGELHFSLSRQAIISGGSSLSHAT